MSHNTAKYNFDTLSCLLCEGFRKDLFKVQLVEMIRAIVSKIKMSAFFLGRESSPWVAKYD